MQIEDEVRAILRARGRSGDLPADLPLGAGGLALDSISLVELLLECDEHFGASLSAELLAGEPLTVGQLAARYEAAVRA